MLIYLHNSRLFKISKNVLTILLIAFPICFYFYIVLNYSSNIPYWDDFDCIMSYINSFKDDNLTFSNFFINANEHKLLVVHFFTFTNFYILKEIDYKIIIIIGNLFLFGFYLFSILKIKVFEEKIIRVSFGFLLFQFSFYEIFLWGLPSIQHFCVLIFTSISFYSLISSKKYYHFLPIVFSLLAINSFGNGISTIPIAFYLLFILKKKNTSYLIWVVYSVIIFIFYFYNYQTPSQEGIFDGDFIHAFKYFFHLVSGALLLNNYNAVIGFLIIVMLLSIFILNHLTLTKDKLIFNCLIIFAVVSQLLVVYFRSKYSFGQAACSRYKIYSVLELIIIVINGYILTNEYFKIRYIKLLSQFLVLLLSVYLYKFSYKHSIRRINNWKENQVEIIESFQSENKIYFHQKSEHRSKDFEKTLNTALKNGTYKIPEKYKINPSNN